MINKYDIGVIGGGLAGLALSIQLCRWGHTVVLFEKEQYPFHRVCGEYISMESWEFLEFLGLDLERMDVSVIKTLQLSGKNGQSVEIDLPLGGFGISRYTLDAALAQIAKRNGVVIRENTRIDNVRFNGNEFIIESGQEECHVQVAAGSFGKRSNLDVKWRRPFVASARNRLNNYVGVKYHVDYPGFPGNLIGLHLFKSGYCGIVKVDNGVYNLCYLTKADNLRENNGSIGEMERNILMANPLLNTIFSTIRKSEEPVTISQISFDHKSQVEDHVLMIGDAAGMITPLCGNGMSMALHASKIAAQEIDSFLKGSSSRKEMEMRYNKRWTKEFGSRLRMGRLIQKLFLYQGWTNVFIAAGRKFPGLIKWMIRQTHGKGF